jgi:hypothetical protein
MGARRHTTMSTVWANLEPAASASRQTRERRGDPTTAAPVAIATGLVFVVDSAAPVYLAIPAFGETDLLAVAQLG